MCSSTAPLFLKEDLHGWCANDPRSRGSSTSGTNRRAPPAATVRRRRPAATATTSCPARAHLGLAVFHNHTLSEYLQEKPRREITHGMHDDEMYLSKPSGSRPFLVVSIVFCSHQTAPYNEAAYTSPPSNQGTRGEHIPLVGRTSLKDIRTANRCRQALQFHDRDTPPGPESTACASRQAFELHTSLYM
jgi:hypothetical protein